MEDFGAIEDDYINIDKKLNICEQKYEALNCESAWFLSSCKDEDELITLKYKADYFYLKKKYSEAIDFYKMYMNTCTTICLTMKRECLEGICRSYLSLHCFCFALKYANELKTLCSNVDTHTASLALLYDCTFKAHRFKDAVVFGKKLVLLHCSNSDVWLKLSLALSLFYKVSLLYVVPQPMCSVTSHDTDSLCESKKHSLQCACKTYSDNESPVADGVLRVLVCLLYAEFHLQSIMNSSLGFALPRNVELQEKIWKETQRLCSDNDYVEVLRENIKILFTGLKTDKDALSTGFVDRASAKFTSAEKVTDALEQFNEQEFEKKWFSFI